MFRLSLMVLAAFLVGACSTIEHPTGQNTKTVPHVERSGTNY